MNRFLISVVFAAMALTVICDNTAHSDDVSIYNNVEYPLPTVPESLHLPQDRAKFATLHFWDAYDTAGPCATDISCMQQAIANFAALAKINDDLDDATFSINALVQKSSKSEKAAGILSSAAELCLDDPESPVYDKTLYAALVRSFAQADDMPRWITSKYSTLENLLSLNAVGAKAADFSIELVDGAETSLWNELGRDYTIVVLYDPECSHCDIALNQFSAEPMIEKWIEAGMAKVAAVDIRPSEKSREKAASLPGNWIRGIDMTGIEEEEIYYISSTPSLYLLDANGTVMIKDADPTDILEAIWAGKK